MRFPRRMVWKWATDPAVQLKGGWVGGGNLAGSEKFLLAGYCL